MNASIQPGQEIYVRKESELSPEDAETLRRLRLHRQLVSVWVTHVDGAGISFYVNAKGSRPDMEAFIPTGGVGLTNWTTFFEPGYANNRSYVSASRKHYTRRFPTDFL